MKLNIMMMCLTQLFNLLSPDLIKKVVDGVLNYIEEFVLKTTNEIDNAFALPIISMIRTSVGVLDTNGGEIALTGGIKSSVLEMVFQLLNHLFSMIPPASIKDVFDKMLDLVENLVANSETKIDDQLFIPITTMIRTTFDIPDCD